MARNQHFRQGRGVFTCGICGRRTRDAGDNHNSSCCPECYGLAGCENSILDGAQTIDEIAAERDYLVAKAVRQGSDETRIRAEFARLWATNP